MFTEKIKNNTAYIKTGYDMVAYCFSYIEEVVENQNLFLGEYIETNANAEKNNPNLDMLNQLAMQVKHLFEATSLAIFICDSNFNKLLALISSTEKELQPYGDDSMNAATIPFFVLRGLDLFFQDCEYETCKTEPLNDYLKDSYLVYISAETTLMNQVIIRRNYPNTISRNGVRQCFSRILIMKTSEIPRNFGIPQMVTLNKESESLGKIIETNKIKIALIPTLRDAWLDFPVHQGALFSVRYDEQRQEAITKRVLMLLNKAIDRKANIIVFPEYICKEKIQNDICKNLSERSQADPKSLENLLFVVAGSGWIEDSNNVSCLYSYDGYLLGKVYKHSAYDNPINGQRYIEALKNPGKEITLIKIPEIGISQVAICRDLSEDTYSSKLAETFQPQFLLVSAWSASLNIGFQTQMDNIISKNHKTCALISNCCAALEDNKDKVNIIAAPQKNKSVVKGRFRYARRTKQKCHACCSGGCIYEVCYDFNGTKWMDVRITCKQIT